MVKQNSTKAAKNAKSTATRTETAESVKQPVSVEGNSTGRRIFYKSANGKRYMCMVNERGEEIKELMGYDEIFQDGFFSSDGKIPFSEDQINFIIDNACEIGILVDAYNSFESSLLELMEDEKYDFRPEEDQEVMIQCFKSVVKRRYAETIRTQAAGI